MQNLAQFTYPNGFDTSRQPLDPRLAGTMGEGSQNLMCIDNGENVPFGGYLSKGANTGSPILTTLGDTWGGIKNISQSNKTFVNADVDVANDTITITAHGYTTGMAFTLTTTGSLPGNLGLFTTYYAIIVDANKIRVANTYTDAVNSIPRDITGGSTGTATVNVASIIVGASGSLIQDIGASIWGIGAGQPHREGVDFTSLTLSSLLKVLLAVNGSYTAPTSGAWVAGLPQPSIAEIAVLAAPSPGYEGLLDGAISIKIARLRTTTGARSVASLTSAVVVPNKKTIRVTFPQASTGQTHWAIFGTQNGFGGVGISYRFGVNDVIDIPESVVAASTVDGVPRSLEVEYRDGDLLPEEAYIDDYPPPAGTHVARVETSMVVFGCYSDSVSAPSTASPGTCAAVSLPNFPESYKPRHLLFFPEPVVTVLSRLIDSYCYVLCRNSIHAIQFVGFRGDLPSCTISTVSPDVGVAKPQNACQAYGRLFLWNEKAGIVAMNNDGSLDYEFGAAIRKYTKNWDNSTVIGSDPSTRSITAANGSDLFEFCLQTGKWSSPIFSLDYGVSGLAEASVTTRGTQIMSFNNAGSHTAYTCNQGATSAPAIMTSQWSDCGTRTGKNLYHMNVSGEFSVAGTLFTGLHTNLRKRVFRDASVSTGSSTVTSLTANPIASDIGKQVFIFGAGIGGVGINYLAGRIASVPSGTTFTIQNIDGTALTSAANLSSCTLIIAKQVFMSPVTAAGSQDIYDFYPEVQDARQISVSHYFLTDAKTGQIFETNVGGVVSGLTELGVN